MDTVKCEAVRFQQGSLTFYLTKIPAGVLAKEGFTDVKRWTPQATANYQRGVVERQKAAIREYISRKVDGQSNPLMPFAMTLSARGAQSFAPYAGAQDAGILEIRRSSLPLDIIDGQQRQAAIAEAVADDPSVAGLQIPAVVGERLSADDALRIFYMINGRSAAVGGDYRARNIQSLVHSGHGDVVKRGHEWLASAADIIDSIVSRPDHPFSGKISIPGVALPTRRGDPSKPVTQKAIQNALRRPIQSALYQGTSPKTIAAEWVDMMRAAKSVWGPAFKDWKGYILPRPSGLYVLTLALPELRTYAAKVDPRGRASQDAFKAVFDASGADVRFWSRRKASVAVASGYAAYYELAASLLDGVAKRMGRIDSPFFEREGRDG